MRPMMSGMRPGMLPGGYGPPYGGMQPRPPMMGGPGYGPPHAGPPGMQHHPGMYGGPPAQYGAGGHPGSGPAANMCGDGLGRESRLVAACALAGARWRAWTARDDARRPVDPTPSPGRAAPAPTLPPNTR